MREPCKTDPGAGLAGEAVAVYYVAPNRMKRIFTLRFLGGSNWGKFGEEWPLVAIASAWSHHTAEACTRRWLHWTPSRYKITEEVYGPYLAQRELTMQERRLNRWYTGQDQRYEMAWETGWHTKTRHVWEEDKRRGEQARRLAKKGEHKY